MTLLDVELKNFREQHLESDRPDALKPNKRELVDAARAVIARLLNGTYDFASDVFIDGKTKGSPATLEFSYDVDGRRFRYGVDLLPGRVHSEYLFEEIDFVEELIFGREGNDLVSNEERFADGEETYEATLPEDELLLRVADHPTLNAARSFFQTAGGARSEKLLVVTGAAGFIGSVLVGFLNQQGHDNLVLVDEFSRADKLRNLEGKRYTERIERADFVRWFTEHAERVEAVFHLGARTDTTEQDVNIFIRLNVDYSKALWTICSEHRIPLLYASSAATYGLGEHGYQDSHEVVRKLKPLNPYGKSKNDFDGWALERKQTPPFWAGFKFFNVYGPNEYHKGRMASVIFHTARQIRATGGMNLFRSHRDDYADGEQRRDFVYVKDVVALLYFFFEHQKPERSGLYNLGTGTARTFYDLAANTFAAMDREPNVSFVDTPPDIRDTYQYFTEADMAKVRAYGYERPFYTLEAGIEDYVRNYLMEEKIYGAESEQPVV